MTMTEHNPPAVYWGQEDDEGLTALTPDEAIEKLLQWDGVRTIARNGGLSSNTGGAVLALDSGPVDRVDRRPASRGLPAPRV